MKILGLIPARGGSKGIPDKNIVPLNGRPLIDHTIQAALGSRLITQTILSSDSKKIIAVAERRGVEVPFVRPAELAGDDTPALPVIQHAVNWMVEREGFKPDYVVLLQPTSPLRTAHHIDQALERLINSDADSIVSVVKVPHIYSPFSVMQLEGAYLKPYLQYNETRNLRQLKPQFFARNGAAIYAFTYECLIRKKSIYGDKIIGFEMSREESIDIDDLFDLKICELVLTSKTSG
jgi:N-acylneuraminate cytidylyltransferase/CMP-N,N'-diacetyllegionaminic acid synthase